MESTQLKRDLPDLHAPAEPLGNFLDVDPAIDLPGQVGRGMDFQPAQVGFEVAMGRQVLDLDGVEVHKLEHQHPHRRKLKRHLPADGAHADDGDGEIRQAFGRHEVPLADVAVTGPARLALAAGVVVVICVQESTSILWPASMSCSDRPSSPRTCWRSAGPCRPARPGSSWPGRHRRRGDRRSRRLPGRPQPSRPSRGRRRVRPARLPHWTLAWYSASQARKPAPGERPGVVHPDGNQHAPAGPDVEAQPGVRFATPRAMMNITAWSHWPKTRANVASSVPLGWGGRPGAYGTTPGAPGQA